MSDTLTLTNVEMLDHVQAVHRATERYRDFCSHCEGDDGSPLISPSTATHFLPMLLEEDTALVRRFITSKTNAFAK